MPRRLGGGRKQLQSVHGDRFSVQMNGTNCKRCRSLASQIVSECDRHLLPLSLHCNLLRPTSRLHFVEKLEHCSIDIFNATEGDFDVVLIDIDKEGYVDALEAAIPRVRKGGLILADNVLWGGRTASEAEEGDTATAALRAFNSTLYADSRLQTSILPTGDGLSVSLVL